VFKLLKLGDYTKRKEHLIVISEEPCLTSLLLQKHCKQNNELAAANHLTSSDQLRAAPEGSETPFLEKGLMCVKILSD